MEAHGGIVAAGDEFLVDGHGDVLIPAVTEIEQQRLHVGLGIEGPGFAIDENLHEHDAKAQQKGRQSTIILCGRLQLTNVDCQIFDILIAQMLDRPFHHLTREIVGMTAPVTLFEFAQLVDHVPVFQTSEPG